MIKKKKIPAMLETLVWSLGQEDIPGEGNGYPLQYYFPMTDHGVTKVEHDWATNTLTKTLEFPRLHKLGEHSAQKEN